MAVLHTPSREELASRRDAILSRLEVTAEQLRARAAAGGLVGDEWSAWSEIRELDYLLGDE